MVLRKAVQRDCRRWDDGLRRILRKPVKSPASRPRKAFMEVDWLSVDSGGQSNKAASRRGSTTPMQSSNHGPISMDILGASFTSNA